MSEYVKNKKEMNFQNHESLKNVQKVIEDADKALNLKSRKLADSPIGETLAGTLGAAGSFAGLYFGGSVVGLSAAGITSGLATAGALVGGGMAAGVFVLAAPVAILGGGAVAIASHHKNKKLKETKELIYKDAIAKQTAIIKALKNEKEADKERIDYLNSLNILLQAAIRDLKHDLGV